MANFDVKLIYSLIENSFGISKEDIEKIDLQDGKKDAGINGISLFHFFKKGKAKGILGNDVLKSASIFMKDTTQIELTSSMQTCGSNSENRSSGASSKKGADAIVERIINEIYKVGFANLDEPIKNINADNVVEVLEKYQKASDKKNSAFGRVLDHETLFEAILDESIRDKKKKEYINHIKDALIKRINNLRGNASYTGELFSKALDTAIKMWWPFQNSDKLDKICNEFIKIIKQLETMKVAGEAVTPAKAKKINRGFIEELKYMGIDPRDLLGDGLFNHDSIQEGGNCWIHSGINAMLTVPKSKQYLNNLIHKNSNGNTVVYLPGAKDEGLPKPKGDGIYVYTEKQIGEALTEESAGDGEYTAMCLAMRDYRREKENNPTLTTTGGNFQEFCQLVYGKDSLTVLFCDRHVDKDLAKKAKEQLDSLKEYMSDYQIEEQNIYVNWDSYDNIYKSIKQAYDTKKYMFKVSISGANYYRILDNKPVVPDDNAGHAMAIIDMNDSYVMLKDSNDPKGEPIKINKSDFVKICTVEGYKVE